MLHLPRRSGKSASPIGSVAGLGSVLAAGGAEADGCMPGLLPMFGCMPPGMSGVDCMPDDFESFIAGVSVAGVGVLTPGVVMAGAAAPAVTCGTEPATGSSPHAIATNGNNIRACNLVVMTVPSE